MELHAFNPSQLGIVIPSNRSRLNGESVMRDKTINAAIDGPMFGDGGRLIAGMYDRARGVSVPSANPDRGMTLFVENGAARVARGWSRTEASTFAVQLYPSLVWDGQNEASAAKNIERVYRAAVGILRDGRVFFAVEQNSMFPFARNLIAAGAVYAGYPDGGSSTDLRVRGRNRVGYPNPAPVPAWIVANEPPGDNALLTAGLVGLSAFAAWKLWPK